MGGGLTSPDWRTVGASVAGTSHLARATECEDAHRVAVLPGGRLVVTVADGAGSARSAATGSKAAVDAAVDAAICLLAIEAASCRVVARMVGAARAALELAASTLDVDVADLATTLAVVVGDERQLVVGQIGDGGVVIRHEGGWRLLASDDEPGEYLNETRFVTSTDWASALRVEAVPIDAVDGVAVFTDGLQLVALDMASRRPHTPFFDPLLEFVAGGAADDDELAAFLESPRLSERTDDDKTIVLAARDPA